MRRLTIIAFESVLIINLLKILFTGFSSAKNVISITNVKDYRSQTIIGVVAALLLQTIVFDREKWASRRSNQSNKNVRYQGIRKVIKNYLEHSTLHGLRFIGDDSISLVERLIWMILIACALGCAIYFIINIYAKYDINPVIITMNPTPTAVQDIPFPSITVCSMSLIKKSDLNSFTKNGSGSYKNYLDEVCEFMHPYFTPKNTVDGKIEDEDLLNFISNISRSCDKILTICKWIDKNVDCNLLFRPIITDMGLCCTFNHLPLEFILKNTEPFNNFYPNLYNIYDQLQVDDWNPEQGYTPGAAYDVFPFRSRGPGAHLGLSLIIDTNVDDYYCSSNSGTGVKVLLHNPAELPVMKTSSFMLPPELEIRAVFKPIINDATNEFRSIDITKRRCYFADERSLTYFRTYTTANCLMECLSNITFQKCGCVPYYLPRNISTKICGMTQKACSNNVRDKIEIGQTQTTEEKECNCLAECFQVKYEKSMSYGKLSNGLKIDTEIMRNKSKHYFLKNMISFQLYFGTTEFNKFTKSELYRFTDILSLIGGILGLFLGFGALSIVEILYHFTLKWMCRKIRSKR